VVTSAMCGHLERHFAAAAPETTSALEQTAREQRFHRRDVLHARGMELPPFVVLEGHVMYRRVVETGQVRAAMIVSEGHLGGLRSISAPDADAPYELVGLTDGAWATWDPASLRQLALCDGGLAVGLLDLATEFSLVLDVRLDEQSFSTARQRMASILLRYGSAIFDTPRPVAQRADLAAMIGTSRVMMYRTLRSLEEEHLVMRERTGGIKVLDERRLRELVEVAPPEGAPPL
jgi:CRP-like cAMP-binding protein